MPTKLKPPRDKLFPKRPQGSGFNSERAAVRAAREALGGKARKGVAFVISAQDGVFAWLGASTREVVEARIAAARRRSKRSRPAVDAPPAVGAPPAVDARPAGS